MKIVASITPNKTKFGPLLFPGDLEYGCKFLSDLGYQGVEVSLRDSSNREETAIVEKSIQKTNLEVVAIATGQSYIEDQFSLYSGDEILRKKCIERLKGHIDFASHYGAAVIVGGIRGTIKAIQFYEEYITLGENALLEICNYASKKGIKLFLEPVNRYETNIINIVNDARQIIDKYDLHNVVKILADAFHMNIEEVDMEEALVDNEDYIGALHCADSNRYAPSMGHTDFTKLVSKLNKQKVKYLGAEILPWPDSEKAAEVAFNTLRSIIESIR
jgi:sugar phosphate isomerase/epimerase